MAVLGQLYQIAKPALVLLLDPRVAAEQTISGVTLPPRFHPGKVTLSAESLQGVTLASAEYSLGVSGIPMCMSEACVVED